jgi:hypothetical protein
VATAPATDREFDRWFCAHVRWCNVTDAASKPSSRKAHDQRALCQARLATVPGTNVKVRCRTCGKTLHSAPQPNARNASRSLCSDSPQESCKQDSTFISLHSPLQPNRHRGRRSLCREFSGSRNTTSRYKPRTLRSRRSRLRVSDEMEPTFRRITNPVPIPLAPVQPSS